MERRLHDQRSPCVLIIVLCVDVCLAITTSSESLTTGPAMDQTAAGSEPYATTDTYQHNTPSEPLLPNPGGGGGGRPKNLTTTEHSAQTTSSLPLGDQGVSGNDHGIHETSALPGSVIETSLPPADQDGTVTASEGGGGGSSQTQAAGGNGDNGGPGKHVTSAGVDATVAPDSVAETTAPLSAGEYGTNGATDGGTGGGTTVGTGGGTKGGSANHSTSSDKGVGSDGNGNQTTSGRNGTELENTRVTNNYTTPSSLRNTTENYSAPLMLGNTTAENGTFISSPNARRCYECHGKECENLTIARTCQSVDKVCYILYDLEISAVTLGCTPLIPSSEVCADKYLHAATYCEYCCKTSDYCNDMTEANVDLKAWCTGDNGAMISGRSGAAIWVFPIAMVLLMAMEDV